MIKKNAAKVKKGVASKNIKKESTEYTARRKLKKGKKISNNLRMAIQDWKPMLGEIKNGECPKCFGHYIAGHKCDCPCQESCRYYTYDNMGERSRQNKWERFLTVQLDEKMDWESNDKENIDNVEPSTSEFIDGNGKSYKSDDINMAMIQTYVWIAIESPETAKAMMMKLNPNIKSLQDIADILGLTKQAIHKRIANELGLGKRNLKTSLLRLTGKELDVYKMCVEQKLSIRKAAAKLKLSKSDVERKLMSIKEKGFIEQSIQ